jgi:hypothetical protein
MARPYFVLRIQLSAEICTDRAKPMAVAGRLSNMKKGLERFRCPGSMSISYKVEASDAMEVSR